ncbi:perlucin-like isoform X2 [Haliotis rubra]|uniref:perlucin-like isoform X2 n=1 Tax=Haliotis rubra TaxID=36100 RepID=UPI001EE5F292|nr:perlucin-like isoform X2 [Haliotis rubra]
MQLEILSALVCFVVTVNAGCPLGFVHHKRSCYWFSVVKGSFAEAHAYCQYLEGHLATIESRDEDLFVRGHARRHGKAHHYWLGGTDLNIEGKWMWEGQRRFSFTNWYHRQPDNAGHREHCLEIRKHFSHYLWNDWICSHNLNFICEKKL